MLPQTFVVIRLIIWIEFVIRSHVTRGQDQRFPVCSQPLHLLANFGTVDAKPIGKPSPVLCRHAVTNVRFVLVKLPSQRAVGQRRPFFDEGKPTKILETIGIEANVNLAIGRLNDGEGVARIRTFIERHNENPKPYRWTKSADEILAAVKQFCQKTERTLCSEF